ncbi:MAG: hypothetical protein ABI151_02200 [Chitinophagaceae bacterium]
MKFKFFLSALGLMIAFSSCKKTDPYPLNPLYDLDIRLSGEGKDAGTGFIQFRQNPDTARVITLETTVSHLRPNHAYLLQRAVNPIADVSGCSSTAWLTLGEGLEPRFILTDAKGEGNAKLWRDISSIPRGTAFHIHFQILDAATSSPVLTSGCFDYTVR